MYNLVHYYSNSGSSDGTQIMASTISNRLKLFFKNIYLDYYETFNSARLGAKARPIRASFYGMSTLFVLNMFRTNEDLRSYHCEVISACNRVGSLTENLRNPKSYEFVKDIGELHCHGLLRQVDLGFSTIIYKSDCSPENALYRYNCKHLNPTIKEFFQERLVDLGVLGHWLKLELKMKDYDINEEEYKDLVTTSSVQQNNSSENSSGKVSS